MFSQEPSLHIQQLHNLPLRLLRLPLLNRGCHNHRLLPRPPRLLPDPRSLLRPTLLPVLLHLRLPLARLHRLHLRDSDQYRGVCGRDREARAEGCHVYL